MECVHSAVGKCLLEEIHAGQCGVHASSRTSREGFQNRILLADSKERCSRPSPKMRSGKFLAKQQHLAAQQMQTILVTLPFVLGAGYDRAIQKILVRVHPCASGY
jgi:hypothetical protein